MTSLPPGNNYFDPKSKTMVDDLTFGIYKPSVDLSDYSPEPPSLDFSKLNTAMKTYEK